MKRNINIFFYLFRIFLVFSSLILNSQNGISSSEKRVRFSTEDSLKSEEWIDGPYIEWLNEKWIKMVYYKYDAKRDKVIRKIRFCSIREDEKYIQGKFGDTNSYSLEKKINLPQYEYSGIEELIVIGDVHGGVSPQFLEMDMNKEKTNTLIRKSLNGKIQNEDIIRLNFLLDIYGPFSYRGYLKEMEEYPMTTEKELDDILIYFDVNHIIFGHTETKYFRILYDKKLMSIDVPLRFSGKSEQALYFSGTEIYKIYNDGTMVKL
ncbi:MAG: hypothetical protein KAS71_01495 [Bacteroidales bacterium]|nr:hypothetical protein [Bacteroidales bacterium]